MTGLTEVARELYALPLGEFVTARNARAKEIDDPEVRSAVQKLPKPSIAGWAANMLSLHRPDVLGEVLDVGADLREAQGARDGAALRALDRDRRDALRAVEDAAKALAGEHGQSFGPAAVTALHETMLAALSDPDAAEAVRSGVLVAALGPPGFGPVDLTGATAVDVPAGPARTRRARRSPAPPKAPPPDRVAEQRAKALAAARKQAARAERDVASAEAAVETARARRDDAEQKRQATEKHLAELTQQVAGLDRRVTDAEKAVTSARADLSTARAAVDRHDPGAGTS
ncbi:MAG: hypothetical protein ABWX71_01735 [Aeromicrobium sp.]